MLESKPFNIYCAFFLISLLNCNILKYGNIRKEEFYRKLMSQKIIE